MTWTILSLHFLLTTNVYFVGEYPTQAKCLAALKEKNGYFGSEIPPDLQQCVYIKKEKLYAQAEGVSYESDR